MTFQVMARRHSEILKLKDNNSTKTSNLSDISESVQFKDPYSFNMTKPNSEDLVNSINKENQTVKFNRRKNNDFIYDKQLRIKSYMRRRGIPFRRCSELDIQCGTKSFHLQISKDLDEALYSGSPELLELFLSTGGLKLSDLNKILIKTKRKSSVEEDDSTFLCDSDDEFLDPIKSKNRREKESKAESARRISEVEFFANPFERNKRFKSVKDGILSKVSELENVSGVTCLTLILNPDKDLLVYSGDPALVTALFTSGVRRGDIPVTFNVRIFDNDEVSARESCACHK